MPPRQIHLAIDSSLEHVGLVGAAVRGAARLAAFAERTCRQIELSAVEAVNNAIRHAYAGRPGHLVEIDVRILSDALVIEVLDRGTPMRRPLRRVPLAFDPEDRENLPEGGMGLFLIQSIMDDVRYVSEKGSNRMTMTKKLQVREPCATSR